jgi:deoxyribodipyrimidine photo-lyase
MAVIHWFRRDVRVGDNTGLAQAAQDSKGDVVPVFILDDRMLKGKDIAPARVQFLLDSLRELDAQLHERGSRLIVRRGEPEAELHKLAREVNANAVYFNRDYTPTARKRDARITQSLQNSGIRVESFKDQVIFEEDDLLTGTGKPYTVFTPYKKNWLGKSGAERVKGEGSRNLQLAPIPAILPSPPLPSAGDLGFTVKQDVPKGGESQAQKLLNDFVQARIDSYDDRRDFPAQPGTSFLSPHLRFGTISPRQCLTAALAAKQDASKPACDNIDVWISELVWREFYIQILYHFPHADHANFKREYDALTWGNDGQQRDDALFAAWCEGRTGYPIVDAAMRQLNQTAWMHNRARMIVASFFTKDLLLDWRRGESYFMQNLVDGDPAANNGGWQWASSTGTDAQPYFRVFNPRLQSERFDPAGVYIKRWVPELTHVPAEFVHAPHEMPPLTQASARCIIGEDYPAPIVDHAAQKEKFVRRCQALRKDDHSTNSITTSV